MIVLNKLFAVKPNEFFILAKILQNRIEICINLYLMIVFFVLHFTLYLKFTKQKCKFFLH